MPLPEYLSNDWFSLEETVMERAKTLLHENSGEIRFTLDALYQALRDEAMQQQGENANYSRGAHDAARDYANRLTGHVEQCWATAILR